MKMKHNSYADLRPRSLLKSDEDDGEEADSHYIVVELEDENEASESEMDLSSFAPVESSESEEEEDELDAFSWRRLYTTERDSWEDVASSSGSFKGHRKMDPECSAANRKMDSNKGSMKHCVKCNMAFGVATKVCKACGVTQPMKRKLQNKIKKYDEAWANTQMENGNLNKLFDETNLLLHKWQLLGMYPLFLLGRRRRSKTVAKCLCPIAFNHPQYREAQDTMRQIFVGLINAQLPAPQPPVTHSPAAQPPVTHSPAAQPPVTHSPAAQPPVTHSPAAQPPVTHSPAAQPPIIQSLAQPSISKSPGKPPVTRCPDPQPFVTHYTIHPPMTPSLATQQEPVTHFLVQPPVAQTLAQSLAAQPPDTQFLCSTLPTVSKGTDMGSTPAPTLNKLMEYQKLKSKERTKMGKNEGSKQKQRKVQINVGIMCLHNGCLKPQRGKMLLLLADPQITAKDLLLMAEKKFKDRIKSMEEGPYILLYPDGSEVINVPGTQKPFTLKGYKSEIGKTYARINLFICRKRDFEEQFHSSESDTDVVVRTRISDESNLADTLPTPGLPSTP